MKNVRLMAILFGILVTLGGIATWDEWQTKKDEHFEKTKNRIIQFTEAQIDRIEYRSKSFEEESSDKDSTKLAAKSSSVEYLLEKNTDKWQIVQPISALADQNTIASLLNTLLEYSFTEVIGEGEGDFEKYGLKDPLRTISLFANDPNIKEGEKRKSWTIFIGNKVPVGYNVYFRTSESNKVYMGSQHLLLSTAKSLFDVRDKTVAKIDSNQLKNFQFFASGVLGVEIDKTGELYQFISPKEWLLDQQDFRDYLSFISDLKATSFIDQVSQNLDGFSANPDYEMRWTNQDGSSHSLKFASKDSKYWVLRDQIAIEISEMDYKKISRNREDFRSKRIFGTSPMEILKLEVDGTKYERKGGLFYKQEDIAKVDDAGSPKKETVNNPVKDVSHIAALVADLELLKTDRFYQQADSKVAEFLARQPQHNLTLEVKDQHSPIKVGFFESEEKDYFLVKHSSSEIVFRIKKSDLANIKENSSKNLPQDQTFKEGATVPSELLKNLPIDEELPLDSQEEQGTDITIDSKGDHS